MDIKAAIERGERMVWEAMEYTNEDGQRLCGRLVWADEASTTRRRKPCVLLVHTAVGPHDLFLHWKAEALAALGLVVMIVDMYGDADGSAWDKKWQTNKREAFKMKRSLFRVRMECAMSALRNSVLVDASRVAVMGYCFGGPPALHFGRSGPEGLRAVVTFHGACAYETENEN